MEDQSSQTSDSRTRVSFPGGAGQKKKSNVLKILIILILLAALGVVGWFIVSSQSESGDATPSPTPFQLTQSTPTPTVAEEKIDKSEVKIEVLNGTSVAGLAGKLKDELVKLGYEADNIETGNSDDDVTTTTVTFKETYPESDREEVIELLEDTYTNVDDKEDDLDEFDFTIVIGTPKNAPASPTAKPAATKTPTPKATVTSAITPTKTPTPTQPPLSN